MTLERWLGLIFLFICMLYGYTAFFVMDEFLPPFMKFNPVWPSSFPKVLAVFGIMVSTVVVVAATKEKEASETNDIDYRHLMDYELTKALSLLGLMALYAFCLRPVGFIGSTLVFLIMGGYVLGERNLKLLVPIALVATVSIWYLVQEVLGIYLLPFPWFMVS